MTTARIYVVLGFLGSGKTTFINKLLAEAFKGPKTALVESELERACGELMRAKGFLLTERGLQLYEFASGKTSLAPTEATCNDQ